MTKLQARAIDEASGSPSLDPSLDPDDWSAFGKLAHGMLDEMLLHVQGAGSGPVWQPMPQAVKAALAEPLPRFAQGAGRTAADAMKLIVPYATGNTHPRFFGWVHGSGTAGGMLAEMLAAAMNSNAGGRDHGAIHVERQVIDWCRELFGFPASASGLLASGTSTATLIALTVARNAALGPDARRRGLAAAAKPLIAYTSSESHSSVSRAVEMLGLGSDALRALPADAAFQMSSEKLRQAIRLDRARGNRPFAVIATAGTVNTGAIDPLAEIADVCAEEGVWLHVDGAFGALLMLSDRLRPRLTGIERADSLAFDFHKWLHVPYDAGCVLVRDGAAHRAAFASRPTYLAGHSRGLAAGEPWPCDYGPELSRGFRALKVWFTLKEHGTEAFAASIEDNCRLAHVLGERVTADPALELLAPVTLNIACFRMRVDALTADQLDRLNEDIVAELQLRGIAAPSTTRIGGKLAIRVNITNHRTRDADIELLHSSVVAIGIEQLALICANPQPAAQAAPVEARKPLPFECLAALSAALERPEIAIACGTMPVAADSGLPTLFQLSPSGSLRIGPDGLVNDIGAAVLLRHGAELALWSRHSTSSQTPDQLGAQSLLAARAAGCYLALLPATERVRAESGMPDWLVDIYRYLARPLAAADLASLIANTNNMMERLLPLAAATSEIAGIMRSSTASRIDAVNLFARDMALAVPVEHLISHGGDARIVIDRQTGRNGYGSSVRPVTSGVGFASSTATCISEPAYASVEAMRQRLIGNGGDCEAELERIRAAVALHSGADRVPGASVVLAASGTDTELAALALVLARDHRPVTSIVISPEETGSGVPQATLGCHFSTQTALGAGVTAGSAIVGLAQERVSSINIAIRDARGAPRPLADIGTDVAVAVEAAVATGRRVLLHVLDAAKTGIGAPALADVIALSERFGSALDVVVDACQARLGSDAVAGYLARGWMVQITGSKFWGGPPFSGALLVPAAMRNRQEALIPLLARLGSYMSQGEWPHDFDIARAALPDTINLGLICRWQAALAEADRLASVPEAKRIELAGTFSAMVAGQLAEHPGLLPVAGMPIDRSVLGASDPWAGLRTIVPIIPTRIDGGERRPVTLDEAKQLHKKLAASGCHLGQPVKIGSTAALRICASGRTLLAMAEPGGIETMKDQLATVFDTLSSLLD